MSEEQPVFKVTDRRLFNADGTPREIEQEPETEKPAAEAKEPAPPSESSPAQSAADTTASTSSAATQSAAQSAQAEQPGASVADEATRATSTHAEEEFPEDDYAESEIPGAEDPASFINFLMSIASNAAAALGMMEHPVTGQRGVDPELGKHWIDVLGMLQQKTHGNLSQQEKQIFEGLLADLRMQYVSLGSTRQPKAPRGFSGSDITGGR